MPFISDQFPMVDSPFLALGGAVAFAGLGCTGGVLGISPSPSLVWGVLGVSLSLPSVATGIVPSMALFLLDLLHTLVSGFTGTLRSLLFGCLGRSGLLVAS